MQTVHYPDVEAYIAAFPGPTQILLHKIRETIKEELSRYKHSKGAVQFPLDQPLPLDLIHRIVIFRIEENKGKKRS